MKQQLVRLRIRPSRDEQRFTYFLDYRDENGKRRQVSLRHANERKAEKQRAQKERELRMGIVKPQPMKLSEFLEDSLARTGNQTRHSTQQGHRAAMKDFISVVGDIDYRKISFRHGESFRQACLDKGNSPATVSKKLRILKRLFQLAVERQQLDENPVRRVAVPKSPKKKIRVFKPDECERILRETQDCRVVCPERLRWDLLIAMALATGMRRGELLNPVWADVDFDAMTVDVAPKKDGKETWEWLIKDTERRTLPLTDQIVSLLVEHQSQQPERYPYVFVPPARYDNIQKLRNKGEWPLSDSRLKVVNNFKRKFDKILRHAGVKTGRFHDLRNTAITNWFANGMSEYQVMKLAGHSSFTTTHQFYLAVADDLVDQAREATIRGMGQILLRTCCAPPISNKSV